MKDRRRQLITGYRPVVYAREGRMLGIRQLCIFLVMISAWSCSDKPSSDKPSAVKDSKLQVQVDEHLMKSSTDAGAMQMQ